MNTTSIVAVRLDDVELRDDPIDPAWIREGAPVARSGQWATSADRTTTTHVWDCTAGRFDWHFGVDEIVHIVEGSVIVSSADSEPRTLRTGDAALFRAGTTALWEVPEYVRKHAVLRRHLSPAARFTQKVEDRLRRILGR
ncbi:cupin domain-containing protein [Rhodococcus pyridinivorans]|uniref:cupin domain-containing protein n=1 Tax=Rhodococcus pyridinivorans TaxID=103816 RepID=UPI001E4FE3A6|nr:cupin domain-containing protein [Rhodococcus pyridinivorans]MCD5418590.1 cupin domain-containing protein [Rhodococcus pyridinivorans]